MPKGPRVGTCAEQAKGTYQKLILLLQGALVALLVQVEEGI